MLENLIGGYSHKLGWDPSQYDQRQLKTGIEVEMEHTSDPIAARKIAMDHLAEQVLAGKKQDYYTRLARMEKSMTPNAVWPTAYMNRLPDSAFLYIGPGGVQGEDGRTMPLSLRKLPYKNTAGKVDLAHLRNAIARLPVTRIPETLKPGIKKRACQLLAKYGGECATMAYAANPPYTARGVALRTGHKTYMQVALLDVGKEGVLVQHYSTDRKEWVPKTSVMEISSAERMGYDEEDDVACGAVANPGDDCEALSRAAQRAMERGDAEEAHKLRRKAHDCRLRRQGGMLQNPDYPEAEEYVPGVAQGLDEQSALRDVRLDASRGHVYRLVMWDTYMQDRQGKSLLGYSFEQVLPEREAGVLFEGTDYGASPMHAIDSDSSVRALLTFLTLRPGDTDREYFEKYTPEQMAFAQGDAEELQMYSLDADEEQMPLVDYE